MYECIHWLQHNSVHHYSCNTTVCITIHATQQRASLFMQHNSVHHYSCNTTVCITIHATQQCASLFMQHDCVHHYSCNTRVCITIHATQQCASLFMQHNSVHHYSCNTTVCITIHATKNCQHFFHCLQAVPCGHYGQCPCISRCLVSPQLFWMVSLSWSRTECQLCKAISCCYFQILFPIVEVYENFPSCFFYLLSLEKNLCQYTDIR